LKTIVQLFTCGVDSHAVSFILQLAEQGKLKDSIFYNFTKGIIPENEEFEIKRCYFDLRSRYSQNEIEFLAKKCCGTNKPNFDIHTSLDIKDTEQDDAFVPNRNILLVTAAQAIYNADVVLLGGVFDDRVRDNNKQLFDEYSKVLSQSAGKSVIVTSMFWDLEKTEVLALYNEYHNHDPEVRLNLLKDTFSCFDAKGYRKVKVYEKDKYGKISKGKFKQLSSSVPVYGCCKCAACFRRFCALTVCNLYVPFENKELIEKYRTGVDSSIHTNRYLSIQRYLRFLDNEEKI